MSDQETIAESLYDRLGGYNGISIFAGELLSRMDIDPHLARFWQNSDDDLHVPEKQLVIDYLCSNSGGPVGLDSNGLPVVQADKRISEYDWSVFLRHTGAAMHALAIPQREREEIAAFALALHDDYVMD